MAGQFAIIMYEDGHEEYTSQATFPTPHTASVLLDEAVYSDKAALLAALGRTFNVCLHLNIPIHQHFRRIYVQDASGHVQDDWALSDLAFYLLLINGNADNAYVAHAQAYALRRVFQH